MSAKEELEQRQTRASRNQSRCRADNELIAERNEGSAFTEYTCECALRTCELVLSLAVEEYEEVRSSPTHFLIAHGHAAPGVDRVIRNTPRYQVVEKVGVAAEVAVRLDPRSRRLTR